MLTNHTDQQIKCTGTTRHLKERFHSKQDNDSLGQTPTQNHQLSIFQPSDTAREAFLRNEDNEEDKEENENCKYFDHQPSVG